MWLFHNFDFELLSLRFFFSYSNTKKKHDFAINLPWSMNVNRVYAQQTTKNNCFSSLQFSFSRRRKLLCTVSPIYIVIYSDFSIRKKENVYRERPNITVIQKWKINYGINTPGKCAPSKLKTVENLPLSTRHQDNNTMDFSAQSKAYALFYRNCMCSKI